MTQPSANNIAIACGGTGGHLFPGIAVAEQLIQRGCSVTLLISPKDVDQQAVKGARNVEIVTLPAVGLQNRNYLSFARSFWKSWRAAKRHFAKNPPSAALAMGGFTSAPPIFAARAFGAKTFLHESNTIPGRANRWLSRFVDHCFIGFPQAGALLKNKNIVVTGTPVRPQFGGTGVLPVRLNDETHGRDARATLGLDPDRPTLLVMGGSQGASGINDLVLKALPALAAGAGTSNLQFFHLTGPGDVEKVRRAYEQKNLRAVVHPFFGEMELALGAATVSVSRSGASSLAELAAMRIPSVLVPFPAATDNHQFFNAKAFEDTGAARLIEQKSATPETLAKIVLELAQNAAVREQMRNALAKWHAPQAAEQIAETMLAEIARVKQRSGHSGSGCNCGHDNKRGAQLRTSNAA